LFSRGRGRGDKMSIRGGTTRALSCPAGGSPPQGRTCPSVGKICHRNAGGAAGASRRHASRVGALAGLAPPAVPRDHCFDLCNKPGRPRCGSRAWLQPCRMRFLPVRRVVRAVPSKTARLEPCPTAAPNRRRRHALILIAQVALFCGSLFGALAVDKSKPPLAQPLRSTGRSQHLFVSDAEVSRGRRTVWRRNGTETSGETKIRPAR